jgi:hypothetical protein
VRFSRPGFLARQLIIQPERPPNDKAAIGDIVCVAGGPLFDLAVDHERPNPERILANHCSGGVSNLGIWNALCCADAYNVHLAWSSVEC